jgi:hypothetical protein
MTAILVSAKLRTANVFFFFFYKQWGRPLSTFSFSYNFPGISEKNHESVLEWPTLAGTCRCNAVILLET